MPKNCCYRVFVFAISLLIAEAANAQTKSITYTGTPYKDAVYKKGAQKIPGKLQCEYYDFGGEGVAFHDADSINSGSGKLNKPDGSYLHEFRINEAVDVQVIFLIPALVFYGSIVASQSFRLYRFKDLLLRYGI